MMSKYESVQRRLEVHAKAFGATVRTYKTMAREYNADAYSRKGWKWKCNGKHVVSVNGLSYISGRQRMIKLMAEGIEQCKLKDCSYCATMSDEMEHAPDESNAD